MKHHNEIIPKNSIKTNSRIIIGIIVFVGALTAYVAWIAFNPTPINPISECKYIYKQDKKNER